MSVLTASISGIVAGDDLDVQRTVTNIPSGQTLTKAWLTFQPVAGGADPGTLQKAITPSAVAGVGQITDTGASGTGVLLFQLTGADTLVLPIGGAGIAYDIKVLTSANKIYTVEQGKYVSTRRITLATS